MSDLMSELFKWDQDVFLQNLFISLDTNTLRNCREVSILWRGVYLAVCWKDLLRYPLVREGVTAPGGPVFLAHAMQRVNSIVDLKAIRLAFFMGSE